MSDEQSWHLTVHLLGQKPAEIVQHLDFKTKAKADSELTRLKQANKPTLALSTFNIENEKGEAIFFAGSQFISFELKENTTAAAIGGIF